MEKARLWHDNGISIFCSLNLIFGFKVSCDSEDKRNAKMCLKESQSEGQLSPRAMNVVLHVPCSHGETPHWLNENKAQQWLELHPTTVRPALIKDSLQTGASHWADFWNGFLLFPGTHQELRGDSCSIDQSAIDSASGFDKLLGLVESRGWAWALQGYAIELLTGTHCGARGERTIASAQ